MANSSQLASGAMFFCQDIAATITLSSAYMGTRLFVLGPLAVPILAMGFQRWRRRRSFAAVSNADFLVFNLAAAQLVAAVGSLSFLCGHYGGVTAMVTAGMHMSTAVFPGELFFHILTCLDRYVAVVHPVAYLRLRRQGAARGLTLGCVWLLCLGWNGVLNLYAPDLPHVPYFCVLAVALATVSFCSLAVLCVLIRPGPGEAGGNRKQQRVAQSKRRAFHTVWSIAAALLVYFLGLATSLTLENAKALSYRDSCLVLISANWVGLPSSLALPLLFLHRAGKLPRCRGDGRPNPHAA